MIVIFQAKFENNGTILIMIFRTGMYGEKRTEVAKSAEKGRSLILRKRVAGGGWLFDIQEETHAKRAKSQILSEARRQKKSVNISS